MPTYALKRPVILKDERQFAVLSMEGATLAGVAAHQTTFAATGSPTAALVAMLAVECSWPVEAVGKIAAEEMDAIIEALDPFPSQDLSGGSGDPSQPSAPTS